jgi:solute carrier family 32 (vesicular inhibitory amino acid transporter)
MQSSRSKAVPTWESYERGGRSASAASLDSIMEDQGSLPPDSVASSPRNIRTTSNRDDGHQDLRRRRSSISRGIASLRTIGGINNIDNFAKSWTRAAGFREITPARRASITLSSADGEEAADENYRVPSLAPNKGLLRQQFDAANRQGQVDDAIYEESAPEGAEPTEITGLPTDTTQQEPAKAQLLQLAPASSYGGSMMGGSYGTISSKITPQARRRASILVQEQYEANLRARQDQPDKEEEPPRLETDTTKDGEVIVRRIGESTLPMTVFNSINVLIGIGLLALPLGVRDAGWVIGLAFLALAAAVTQYTAKLLAKCLDTNTANGTYGDLAHEAFGNIGRNLVEALFVLELLAANVALVILFSDSMDSLLPGLSVLQWKIVITMALMPLNFIPFKGLSVTSILGIFCCLCITLILFIDGLLTSHTPGSLRHVAKTYAFPNDWTTLPLSFGLFMAPWGGHSVFPAIYKDMRHPQKYNRTLWYTYSFTLGLDTTMAVLGYLMFGDFVLDEVTQNLLRNKHYPHALNITIVILIAIIPVTKVPLSNRPIMDTFNKKFGIDLRQMDTKAKAASEASIKHRTIRATIATLCNVVELGIAIAIPNFDSIMALMGSALCFSICVILPVSFRLRIFMGLSLKERIIDWALIVVSSILAILGVIWAVVPPETIHSIFYGDD